MPVRGAQVLFTVGPTLTMSASSLVCFKTSCESGAPAVTCWWMWSLFQNGEQRKAGANPLLLADCSTTAILFLGETKDLGLCALFIYFLCMYFCNCLGENCAGPEVEKTTLVQPGWNKFWSPCQCPNRASAAFPEFPPAAGIPLGEPQP